MNHYIIYGSFIHGGHLELTEDTLSGEIQLVDFTYDPRNWDLTLDQDNGPDVTLTKTTNFQDDSELINVTAYRPTTEQLLIYDESSSSTFNNLVVEEYKLSGHLPLNAFKWYKPESDPDTRVLHFNDAYFASLISQNKLPTVFGQTILYNKLSYRLQQRVRNHPFNDISDGQITLQNPTPESPTGHCLFNPNSFGTNRAVLNERYEKEKAITILKFSSITAGQKLRLETIFKHEYVYTNEDTNKNLNR
jgi:hypothetical protein